ncbi:MAG: hypothetical protein KatS3mg004_0851 [Bryobacteraceae bacterium]|nr:MAG: hypothetical protein KatS3mg004_0851 [Bryobacteraceae bacterium]
MQGTYRPEDFPKISWQRGPLRLRLAADVTLGVPAGMAAIQGVEMRRFLAATGNRIEGRELAVVGPDDLRWFAIFSAAPAGTARRRSEWEERIVEPDGRRSVLRTVVLPVGGELFQVEILSEEENASLAARESAMLLRSVEVETARRTWWPPAAALALAALWLLYRRRATSNGSSGAAS